MRTNVFVVFVLGVLCSTAFPEAARAQYAFALEFNQGNNRFGSVNLVNGSFTQLGNEGSVLFNDIAVSPAGTIYAIENTSSLVTLDPANGNILTSLNFNVGGIESLAFNSQGNLYGATQGALYTIDPSTANATFIGNFNNSLLGNSGQNIRFAANGCLYDTDGGVYSDKSCLYQLDLVSGAATCVGVVNSLGGLMLENSGSMMYGAGVQIGSASLVAQALIGIQLDTLVPNSPDNPVGFSLLTTDFPINFNFSSESTFDVPEPRTTGILAVGATLWATAWARGRTRSRRSELPPA